MTHSFRRTSKNRKTSDTFLQVAIRNSETFLQVVIKKIVTHSFKRPSGNSNPFLQEAIRKQ